MTDSTYWITTKNRDAHSSYRFSTTDKNHQLIQEMKNNIKSINADRRKYATKNNREANIVRIRLMPRGPRAAASELVYGRGRRRSFDSYLPMEFATHYDVYVQDHMQYDTYRSYSRGFNDGSQNAKKEIRELIDHVA